MKKSTQLIIGAALLGIVALLFILPQSKVSKLDDNQAEKMIPEQAAAEPDLATEKAADVSEREKQSVLETGPEAALEPSPDSAGSEATEGVKDPKEKAPDPTQFEAPINPVLALVDRIDNAAGKVRVLSNLAGSLALTGDIEQASSILAQAEELLNTIEIADDLITALGYFAGAKLHTGETDAAKEILGRAFAAIEKIEGTESKVVAVKQLADTLSNFSEMEKLDDFTTKLTALSEELENKSHPVRSLIMKIQNPEGKVRVLAQLASALAQSGAQEQSASILKQAQEIIESIEETTQKIAAQGFYATAQFKLGREVDALKLLGEIMGDTENLDGVDTKVAAIEGLTSTLSEFHDNEKIQTFIADAKARAQELKHQADPILSLISKIEGSEGRVRVLCNLSGTLAQTGDTKQATAMLAKAQEIVGSIEDNIELAPSLCYLAAAQTKLGKTDEAKATFTTALSTVEKIKGIDAKVGSFIKLINALNELDDQEQIKTVHARSMVLAREIQKKSQAVLRQSLMLVGKMKDGEEKATVLQQIASAMAQPGNAKQAEEIFAQALTLATQIADANKKAAALESITSTFAEMGPGGNFTQLQFSIGWMYFEGQNLPKDHSRAASWFRKAAELGHSQAQVNLGIMHMEGDSVPADNAEALKWFTQAAEQGDAEGQTALGMMYALGRGMEPDLVQANKWISIAAEQGDKDAQTARTKLATKLTPEQLEQSQKLAKEWQDRRGAKPSASTPVSEPPKTAGK